MDKGTHTKDVIFMNSREEVESVGEEDEEVIHCLYCDSQRFFHINQYFQVVPWSFVDALLFTFTVITTIG